MTTPEKFIDTINKLMALASDAGATEAERELAKERADRLILKHQIDRALLGAPDGTTAEQIKVDLWQVELPQDFSEQVRYLLGAVMEHCQLRARFKSWKEIEIVGFETDIAYAEMIWVSVYREFAGNLFPKWRLDLPFDTNVYNFVKGGYKWQSIYLVASEVGLDVKWPSGRFKAAYQRECASRGEEATAHTQRHSAFRASYANSFQSTITSRLREMRQRAEKSEVTDADRYAVALRSNKDKVDAEFYRLFPQHDPEEQLKRSAAAMEAEMARRAAMTQKQRDEEDERRRKQYLKDRKWHQEMQNKQYDPNGWQHGTKVANNVDLSGGKNHVAPKRNALGS